MRIVKLVGLVVLLGAAFSAGFLIEPPLKKSRDIIAEISREPSIAYPMDAELIPGEPDNFAETSISEGFDATGTDRESLPEPALDSSKWQSNPSFRVLDEKYSNELMDEVWAAESESRIANGLASSGLPYISVDSECRSTLCRVELTFGTRMETRDERLPVKEGLRRLANAVISHREEFDKIDTVSAMSFQDERGQYGVLAYFSKERIPPSGWIPIPASPREP